MLDRSFPLPEGGGSVVGRRCLILDDKEVYLDEQQYTQSQQATFVGRPLARLDHFRRPYRQGLDYGA